jgi:predicted double-glycine peptidase
MMTAPGQTADDALHLGRREKDTVQAEEGRAVVQSRGGHSIMTQGNDHHKYKPIHEFFHTHLLLVLKNESNAPALPREDEGALLQIREVQVIKIAFLLIVLAGIADRESLRFSYCTEQGFDDSCGLSVLACLLDKYWNYPSDEPSLAADYLTGKIDKKELRISFADMAKILEKNGFICKAYRMGYEGLRKAARDFAPLIVHYSKPKGHFALVLKAKEHWLITADPAEGCVCVERSNFQDRWSGAVLAAVGTKTAKNNALLAEAIDSAESRVVLLETLSASKLDPGRW